MAKRLEYARQHHQFQQMVCDFVDARIQTIYGEIMKTILAKDLGT